MYIKVCIYLRKSNSPASRCHFQTAHLHDVGEIVFLFVVVDNSFSSAGIIILHPNSSFPYTATLPYANIKRNMRFMSLCGRQTRTHASIKSINFEKDPLLIYMAQKNHSKALLFWSECRRRI